MYCRFCGSQLEDSALTCSQCGRACGEQPAGFPPQGYQQPPYPPPPYQQPYPPPYQQPYQQPPASGAKTLALIGFILTLFPVFPFVGLVLCIVALSQYKRTAQQDGKGLAVAGIVLNAVGFVLIIIAIVAFGFLMSYANINLPAIIEEFPLVNI